MHRSILILLVVCVGCAETKKPLVIKLTAVHDVKTLCTAALQKALDDVAKAGGGTVVIPAGDYLIGSVVMGSNTTLRIDAGATLTGSPNPDDYPIMDVRWEGRWREGHRALIHAKDAEHIAVVGEGTINGDVNIGDLRDPCGTVHLRTDRMQGRAPGRDSHQLSPDVGESSDLLRRRGRAPSHHPQHPRQRRRN